MFKLLLLCFIVKLTGAARRMHQPRSFQKYRYSRRNVVTFLVASEGLSQTARLSSLIPGDKEPGANELATNVLFGLNAIVFSVWGAIQFFECLNGFDWMVSHFLLPGDTRNQRKTPHTIATSAFSHIDLDHFFSNMAALRTFVPDVVDVLGCRSFAYFYVASAYASTFFDKLIFSRSVREPRYSLGASGVLSAVMTFHCLSFSRRSFPVGERTLPAPLAALVWALNDALRLCRDDRIGHGAHLGGALFGALIYVVRMLVREKSRKKLLRWIRDVSRSSRKRRDVWRRVQAAVANVIRSIDDSSDDD